MSLLGCWVNRYRAMHGIYNGARTRLLPYSAMFCRFCHILPTTAIYGQYVAIYGNVPSAAIRNVLPYSARVGLYRVGGMRWERVVMYKVSRGGPVTVPPS